MPQGTFSIVALDPETGELGVGVASRVLAVGAVVPWAQAAAGAIATQAWTNAAFGPDGLRLLAAGLAADAVVRRLVEGDPHRHRRQCGIVDRRGGAAAWTGERCGPWAGHRSGDGWTCQGNLLAGPAVVEAMAEAFAASTGPLAERLLAALDAAQAQGGDRRGQQSAALLVVQDPERHGGVIDRVLDLRVDDAPAPLVELRRLLETYRRVRLPQKTVDACVVAAHHDLVGVRAMVAAHPVLVQLRARWDESALEAAAHAGQREIAEFLLAAGAPLDICTAAMLGRLDAVRAQLREDPAQARATGAHGIPLLYFPAITGQREIAEVLLAAGADPAAGDGGNTPLHGAAQFGQVEMARWLLEHGAPPNARDVRGRTPLRVAREAGHDAVAALIASYGGTEDA